MAQNIMRGVRALLQEANAQIETVSAAEAEAAAARGEATIVDLRDRREIERYGRIPGAFSCPRGMLEFWIDPDSPYAKPVFQQDKTFIFHCAGGWRSALAAKTARDMGLASVAHMDGGFKAWLAAGKPVETVGARPQAPSEHPSIQPETRRAEAYDVVALRGRRADARINRLSMGDLFERIRWSEPDRVILTGFSGAFEHAGNQSLTAAQADDLANRYANAMLAAGVAPGEIVMMVCGNSVEAVVAKIGLAKAAITVAPINPGLAPDVVRELIALTGARVAVVDAEFMPKFAPIFEQEQVRIAHAIAVGAPPGGDVPDFRAFTAGASASEPDMTIHGDDIWQVLFTSGTSATPKGVMCSHTKTFIESLSMCGAMGRGLRFESELVCGGFLPIIYHVGDITLYAAWLSGGSCVLGRQPDPMKLAQAIDQHRITSIWAGLPQVIEGLDAALRARPELDARCVTSIVHGFAPLKPASYASLKQSLGAQVSVTEIIGQTEVCCSHRFWLDQHADLYERSAPKRNYVGLPHRTMAAAILRGDGSAVPHGSGETGECAYRSPAMMAGYLNKPADTAEAFRDGWFHGGDAFCEGEDGQRMLVDRFKDMIKTGGENVSSIRVESVLMQHPAVRRAAAVGLPHARWSEAVTAFVLPADGKTPTEAELMAFARSQLAGFEVPKAVVFVDEFPLAVGDKIRKNKLREQYADLYSGKS